jgi:dipeptidyl aminopeptidase/acylaminoacyl peptidase
LGVIARLKADRQVSKVVIEGISRGALVTGLIAAHDTANTASLAGVVLISGLYDLSQFAANSKSPAAREIVSSMIHETGGSPDALRVRSVLNYVQNVKVPVLILNGAKDDRTVPAQARRLAEELSSHGVQAHVIIYPDYGHQIPVGVRNKEIDPFIDAALKSK